MLVDVEPETLNLDARRVEAALSPRTRAIVPVHFAGQPCDLDALTALARPRGVRIIEDAAHALGAAYRARPIGSIGDAAVFSFHPIKNITTGEGGMITTGDDELARRMRLLRFHGVERDAWKAYGGAQLPLYDVTAPGLKYNLTDIQSAIGIHQLRKLAALNAERERLARRYDDRVRRHPGAAAARPRALPAPPRASSLRRAPGTRAAAHRPQRLHGRRDSTPASASACTSPPCTSSPTTASASAICAPRCRSRPTPRSASSRCRCSRD